MKRLYPTTHKPLRFTFSQNTEDFHVEELPLRFSEKGGFVILKIKKQELSTWELLRVMANVLNIPSSQIGYAGLKDKHATTIQYLSIPAKTTHSLKNFRHPRIEILKTFRHNGPIKMGELKGNRFGITLRKVSIDEAQTIRSMLARIERHGMPNYFGYQRFGQQGDNFEEAKEVAYGEKHIQDRYVKNMLISAYQSRFFNDWLSMRIDISGILKRHDAKKAAEVLNLPLEEVKSLQKANAPLTLLMGEIMLNDEGKLLNTTSLKEANEAFLTKKTLPTGLLPGRRVWRARGRAQEIEVRFDDPNLHEAGERRAAWIFPNLHQSRYDEKKRTYFLDFSLPKGAYATVLIEYIANRMLGPTATLKTPLKEKVTQKPWKNRRRSER